MITLDILYEDEVMIAVNKPAGLLITPDRWDHGIPTIQDMLREYLRRKVSDNHPNIRVVHRLDKDTSGVILLAKNIQAQSYLSKQFEKEDVNKTYYAILRGVIQENEGMINLALMPSSKRPGTTVVARKGKKSITLFQVLERFRHFTFIEANPLTGRTHQVRVHMMSYGYPLAIDPLYGSPDPIYLSNVKKDYKEKGGSEKPIMDRLTLHAFRLSFREPTEGKILVLEAPLPKDFSHLLKALRKYDAAAALHESSLQIP